jgi:hypothetical protein
LTPLNLVVWAKTNAGMGSLYRSQHELLPLFKKGDTSHVNNVSLGNGDAIVPMCGSIPALPRSDQMPGKVFRIIRL